MHPLLNPVTAFTCLKIVKKNPYNLKNLTPTQITRFQEKNLKKIVHYATKVPLYKNLYAKAGIHSTEIKKISDIPKLPLVSKKAIMNAYPKGILPERYNIKQAQVLSTSGSTGKPVTFYTDFITLTYGASLYVRDLQMYGLDWKTTRLAHIGNFTPGKADNTFERGFINKIKFFSRSKNTLSLNAFDPLKELMKRLNTFRPDLMVSYPVTLQHLAYLKMKGHGEHINPKIISVGGYVLDDYTRQYVEEAFSCKVVNIYASAESGGDIASECLHGTWHVNYDYYHVEAIDQHGELVAPGEIGHIVMTRLFGQGTPFIRYTGMDDWIRIVEDYECPCGLRTPILKGGVAGRASTSIILPDGRLFPAASFAILSVVFKEMKTNKVKQFQIIQKTLNHIEILLVIDEELRDTEPSVDLLMKKIRELYEQKVGPEVTITVKEVPEIPAPANKPALLVISQVPREQGYKLIEWNL